MGLIDITSAINMLKEAAEAYAEARLVVGRMIATATENDSEKLQKALKEAQARSDEVDAEFDRVVAEARKGSN